jgi:protein SCO1/2
MERYAHPAKLLLLSFLLLGGASALGQPNHDRTGGSRWGANYFPDVPLITHEGKHVRFFHDLLKDKVVVINFIYTSCPDVCPLETARLSQLQAILGDRVGTDVFMYSISIDPKTDTPEVLADYARRFGAGPGWLFLTGDEDDITLLRKKLKLYRPEIANTKSNDHDLSLIIGNQRSGRWMKRSPMDNPYVLAHQVGGWLHNWKTPSSNKSSYADAPQLRQLGTGESLFRSRCSACHVIGGSDQVPPHLNGRLIGPDLLNVTDRRDRVWLTRWLTEPDKMLAEKDPIATQLYAKHNQVAMPNFSLNEKDVNALIDFMETESRRVERTELLSAATKAVREDGEAVSEKASCCQKKNLTVLAAAGETENGALWMAPAAKAVEETSRVRVISLIVAAGLGCVLLLLSLMFGKGERSSRGSKLQ